METDAREEEEGGGGGGFDPEIIRSYVAYWKRGLRKHWLKSALVFVTTLGIAIAAFRWLPRTYTCKTVLMGQGNAILDGRGDSPLAGAASLIMRHQNLESLIVEIGLIEKFKSRRPPLLERKDQITMSLFGPVDNDVMRQVLVGTLEARMDVSIENGLLVVTVDWADPITAAEIAEAAREGFIRTRHAAETASFQDKMSILEGHATRLRDEVEGLAVQVRQLREEKVARVRASTSAGGPSAAPAPPRVIRREPDTKLSGDQIVQRQRLAQTKAKLTELENDHERYQRDEQRKLAELKGTFAPSHPEIIAAEQRVAAASETPPAISALRAQVSDLERELEQREAPSGRRIVSSGGIGRLAPAGGDAIPTDIIRLLEEDDIDPAVVEQLAGAISRFGILRNEIRSARIELDTAQAAFKHRYKVIVPADPPQSASKPKVAVVLGGGFALALLLAIVLPILLELRTGMIVERWQVHQFALPVLAELRLPGSSAEDEQGAGGPRA